MSAENKAYDVLSKNRAILNNKVIYHHHYNNHKATTNQNLINTNDTTLTWKLASALKNHCPLKNLYKLVKYKVAGHVVLNTKLS